MNKAEAIQKVSATTGIAASTCEKVIKAFEGETGSALVGEYLGTNPQHGELVARIAATTGVRAEDCEKIMTAARDLVRSGISEKLGFLKRWFGRA